MKKKLLFFIFFIPGIAVFSQPMIKIFAFTQENLPGTIPVGVKDENGNLAKKAAIEKNYFIFLSLKKTSTINPLQLFIKGKPYSIKAIHSKKTPIEYTDSTIINSPEKKILVPKTKNKVIELKVMKTATQKKKSLYVQKLINTNDVVIAYSWNKKKYFITLKKIKELNPRLNE